MNNESTWRGLTVGQAARLVGVSIRTLHHWDTVDLVRPSERTWAGYRVYSNADVSRIHRVLVYRELGFPLAEIGRILDGSGNDDSSHLERQRDLLKTQIARLQNMAASVEQMLAATQGGIQMTPEEQAEIFGTDWDPDWAEEAKERWGDTPQWEESNKRAATRTTTEWSNIAADAEGLLAELADAKRQGVAAGSEEANALAEAHKASIDQHYACSYSMQVLLARMYMADSRFTQYYDSREPGLALWLQEAINANAAGHGVDVERAAWE